MRVLRKRSCRQDSAWRMSTNYSPLHYTMLESLIALIIAAIVGAFAAPFIDRAQDKSRFTKWSDYTEQLQTDESAILIYNFQEDDGTTLTNSAASVAIRGYQASDVNAVVSNIGKGVHWQRGRWHDKNSLFFSNRHSETIDVPDKQIFTNLSTISVSVWAKQNPGGSKRQQIISNGGSWWIEVTDKGEVMAAIRLAGGAKYQTPLTRPIMADGRWHHLALVWNGTRFFIYFDGYEKINFITQQKADAVIYNNGEVGNQKTPPTDLLGIGWNRHFATAKKDPRYLFGSIDEVVIWNRALTADDILNHYTSGKP